MELPKLVIPRKELHGTRNARLLLKMAFPCWVPSSCSIIYYTNNAVSGCLNFLHILSAATLFNDYRPQVKFCQILQNHRGGLIWSRAAIFHRRAVLLLSIQFHAETVPTEVIWELWPEAVCPVIPHRTCLNATHSARKRQVDQPMTPVAQGHVGGEKGQEGLWEDVGGIEEFPWLSQSWRRAHILFWAGCPKSLMTGILGICITVVHRGGGGIRDCTTGSSDLPVWWMKPPNTNVYQVFQQRYS